MLALFKLSVWFTKVKKAHFWHFANWFPSISFGFLQFCGFFRKVKELGVISHNTMATSSDTSEANVKSKRPAGKFYAEITAKIDTPCWPCSIDHLWWCFLLESAFKQQRLPAWQPILTAGTVLPTFFVIGIAFIPVGIGLLYFSDEVRNINSFDIWLTS